MTEIDRLAAAYCDSFVGILERRGEDGEFEKDPTTFDELAGDDQELIRHGVRAVLQAMRVPSEAALRGAWGTFAHDGELDDWQEMIDHLLSEGA